MPHVLCTWSLWDFTIPNRETEWLQTGQITCGTMITWHCTINTDALLFDYCYYRFNRVCVCVCVCACVLACQTVYWSVGISRCCCLCRRRMTVRERTKLSWWSESQNTHTSRAVRWCAGTHTHIHTHTHTHTHTQIDNIYSVFVVVRRVLIDWCVFRGRRIRLSLWPVTSATPWDKDTL